MKQKPMTVDQAINRMQAEGGTLTAVVQVTRAATGKTEEHTLVMTPEVSDKPTKRVCSLVVKRKDGSEEARALILRPGDVALLDGNQIAEF